MADGCMRRMAPNAAKRAHSRASARKTAHVTCKKLTVLNEFHPCGTICARINGRPGKE